VRLSPHERFQLVRDGLIDQFPAYCDECGRRIEAGDRVLCNDGYERVYGEYVLSDQDELHEDNWPSAHVACVRA
jgi:hypothetical protein